MLFPGLNVVYLHISAFRSMCVVPHMVVSCSSWYYYYYYYYFTRIEWVTMCGRENISRISVFGF
jgi:hypothetical protein